MSTLHQLRQRPGENIDSFNMCVREVFIQLDLRTLTTEQVIYLMVLSQLINNCVDSTLRKKAVREDMSLDSFLKYACM